MYDIVQLFVPFGKGPKGCLLSSYLLSVIGSHFIIDTFTKNVHWETSRIPGDRVSQKPKSFRILESLLTVNGSLPIMKQHPMNFFRIFWEGEIVELSISSLYGISAKKCMEKLIKTLKYDFMPLKS